MSNTGDRFTDVELENKRLPACYGYIAWKVLTLEEAMKDLRSLLPEIDRFVKLAKRHCTYPNDHGLSKEQAAALYLYTMEMADDACLYRTLNKTLRLENRSLVRPWFAYLKLLDSAVSKLSNFKGTVWRGVNKDVTKTFQKGQKITWWSVSSCSTSVDIISAFLGEVPQSTLFNIECLTGKSIAAFTSYPSEDEVILMPGTMFEVAANPLHHHGGLHIIHLRELADDDDDAEDEKQAAVPSKTATASAAKAVTAKIEKMSIGKDKESQSKLLKCIDKGITLNFMISPTEAIGSSGSYSRFSTLSVSKNIHDLRTMVYLITLGLITLKNRESADPDLRRHFVRLSNIDHQKQLRAHLTSLITDIGNFSKPNLVCSDRSSHNLDC